MVHSKCGVFAEIHHCWCSRDNTLYIWSYQQGHSLKPLILPFDSIILSVALVKPDGEEESDNDVSLK